MSFLEFLDNCQLLLDEIMSGALVSGSVFNILFNPLSDDINGVLQILYDVPLIGPPLRTTVGALIDSAFGDVNIINLMVGVAVPTMLVYSFVKWLVGIINGG